MNSTPNKCEIYEQGLAKRLDKFQPDWRTGEVIHKETYEKLQAEYYRKCDTGFVMCKSRRTFERDIKRLRQKFGVPAPITAPIIPHRGRSRKYLIVPKNFHEKIDRFDTQQLSELTITIAKSILGRDDGVIVIEETLDKINLMISKKKGKAKRQNGVGVKSR